MQNVFNPYSNTPYQMPAFQPFSFTPQQMPQAQTQQGLIKVSGLDGAKAYQMPPNAAVALFHESEDIFYVKTTDGAGFPTIRTFRFEAVEEEPRETREAKYVTVDEFNRFKEELYAKQPVRTRKSTATVSAAADDE